jgi:hypothetical protein
MQVTRYVTQDPNNAVDWTNDWTDFLGANESITGRQWVISPLHAGTPITPALTNDTSAIVRVSGLSSGNVYRLVERVTLLSGGTMDQVIVIRCEQDA